MAIKSWTATGDGNWNTASAWSGGAAPATGDSILIGNTLQAAAFTVTENATLTIAALTMAGNHKANKGTTLSLTQANTLTVNGSIIFDGDSIITGSGTLVANGAITGDPANGTGTIIAADNGTIDVTGTGSIANGVVLDFSTSTTLGSTLRLDLSGGVTSASNIKMSNANQSLIIGPTTHLMINTAEAVSNGTLQMLGGTVTDGLGITVGGKGATGTIVGFDTIAADVTGGGAKGVVDNITASGGVLDLTGVFTDGAGGTFMANIDSALPSTLKFDNTAAVAQPIAMSSAAAARSNSAPASPPQRWRSTSTP